MSCQQDEVRLELLRSFPLDGGAATAAVFAPDGTALATGSELGDLRLLDLPAHKQRWLVTVSDDRIGEIDFSPDGRRLACCGRHLTLHDAADGRELARWPDMGPGDFAWHRDGVRFAFVRGCDVLVYDGTNTALRATFEHAISSLAFADLGELIAFDSVGQLWLVPPDGGPPELRSGPRKQGRDGAMALAGSGSVHAFEVPAAEQSSAVGGEQARVRWERDFGAVSRDIDVPGKVSALALRPDGRTLFVSTYAGHQALYGDEADPMEVPGHAARVRDFAMSPDGAVVALLGNCWVLQPTDGSPPRRLPAARAVVAGRHGPELLVQEAERVVAVDGRTGVELAAVASVHDWIEHFAAGPRDQLLVGRHLVDAATRAAIALPKKMVLWSVADVARTGDGLWALGTQGGIEGDIGTLLVTDAQGKTLLAEDNGPVYTVAFSPDGRRLLYGYGHGISMGFGPPEHSLRVRDTQTFELLRDVPARVARWRFLDDRRALACVGGEVQVWDADTLVVLQTLPLDGPCKNFCLSEDRRTFAYATSREVRVYRLR